MYQNRNSALTTRCRTIRGWLDRPIVLIGMMGVGKSTVGRRLATALGIGFVDADEEIQAAAQMPIADIFERFGEAYFRDGERRVLARLLDRTPRVIATGGGAFMNAETRQLILDQGIAVWLNADLETLVGRVERRDTRPLLRGRDPRAVLTALAAERDPIYAQAPLHVTSARGPHQQTVRDILDALDQWHG